MARFDALAVALMLGACGTAAPQLGNGIPSLATARAALAGGAEQVALNICTRLSEVDRRNSGALACEGDALLALGRTADADTAYTTALVTEPGLADAQLGLGRLRLATDPKRAEELFLRVLAKDPRDAAALNNLGIARDLQGRHSEAQKAYGEAIAANPDMRAAQVNLALSIALEGRTADAVRLLTPLGNSADATIRERHDLAAVLAMDGRVAEATRLLSPDLQGAELDAALAGYRALLARPGR